MYFKVCNSQEMFTSLESEVPFDSTSNWEPARSRSTALQYRPALKSLPAPWDPVAFYPKSFSMLFDA